MKLECEVGCFSDPKPSTHQQRIFDKMNQIENLMQELRYIGTSQEAMLWSSHQPGGDAMVLAPTRRRCYGPRTNQEAMLWSSHQPGGDAMVLAPTRRRCGGPRTNQEAMRWSSHQPGGDAVVLVNKFIRCWDNVS